jgi:hypothetical protein
VSVNGAKILVEGGVDVVALAGGGETAHGTVTGGPGSFHIQAANGTALTIDLTGSVGADGVLTGSGKSGGIYPGGQNGWVCPFTFTATSPPATSSPTSTTPSAVPGTTVPVPTSSVPDFFSPSMNIGCELDYGRTGVPDQAYCQTFVPPQSVTMTMAGTFTPCTGDDCVGNPGENTPTLPYGQASAVGPFLCVSATSGVTCTVSGQGFQISTSGITPVGG